MEKNCLNNWLHYFIRICYKYLYTPREFYSNLKIKQSLDKLFICLELHNVPDKTIIYLFMDGNCLDSEHFKNKLQMLYLKISNNSF